MGLPTTVLVVVSITDTERVGADGDGAAHDGVGGGVDHRHRVRAVVGDVGAEAVRGDRHTPRVGADGDGATHDGVAGGVDHRHIIRAQVGDVGVEAVRG